MKKSLISGLALAGLLATTAPAQAADYVVDTEGAHAFVSFRISHLGTSWLLGRFNDFTGEFSYDSEKPNDSKISIEIDTASIDSNHAERDKHLRDPDFLDVKKYPKATFTSTGFKFSDEKNAVMTGDLTLHGVTKSIDVDVQKVGEGADPWGGYRAGFSGTVELKLTDFGIKNTLGPLSETVYMDLQVEGIRK